MRTCRLEPMAGLYATKRFESRLAALRRVAPRTRLRGMWRTHRAAALLRRAGVIDQLVEMDHELARVGQDAGTGGQQAGQVGFRLDGGQIIHNVPLRDESWPAS